MVSYGIPLCALPITTSGEFKLDEHERWIAERREIDARKKQALNVDLLSYQALPATSTMAVAAMPPMLLSSTSTSNPDQVDPGERDVLFGRGKTVVDAPGNINFRNVVESYAERYEAAGRLEKIFIADVIIRIIKEGHGGRFLKRKEGDDYWVEVDDTTARKKVNKKLIVLVFGSVYVLFYFPLYFLQAHFPLFGNVIRLLIYFEIVGNHQNL
jgi:hypothetical protein